MEMSNQQAGDQWTALGLAYTNGAQRSRLISDHLPQISRLFPQTIWYFADIQYCLDNQLHPAIEVAINKALGPEEQIRLSEWIAKAVQNGAIDQVSLLDAPWVIDITLFTDHIRPNAYLIGLWQQSLRAIDLLVDPVSPASLPDLLQAEIRHLYRTQIYDENQRLSALNWYSQWLLNSSHRQHDPDTFDTLNNSEERIMTTQTEDDEKWWAVVARLCHIQMIRLTGLLPETSFQTELACIQAVLSASVANCFTPPSSEYKEV